MLAPLTIRILIYITAFVFGIVIGSFVNVLIYRIPLNENIATEHSHCMKCKHKVTLNYDTWPALSKMVIVILTLLGACAGSTAGGLKVSRLVILVKNSAREIRQTLRPRSVNVTRLDGCVLPEETVRTTSNYLAIYSLILVIAALLISVDGFTLETNLSASLTCLSNVGPGLGAVGPAGNFAGYSAFSKIVLALEMLIGRLEFFPLLIFFSPSTWKRM